MRIEFFGAPVACDYDTIRRDNQRRYGTDIGRYGPMLLANRYGDRTHFIYELLQNAEDALARRKNWRGSRTVTFELGADSLRVSHFGIPFDEDDIRGVCGIGESTKESLTAIGRFGIGFKSVYAFSNRPEVHSGSEAFAVEDYVLPVAVDPVERRQEETVILIPLQESNDAKKEIAEGLSRLGATSLLFLREIEEIRWSVDGTRVGDYLREAKPEGTGVRRVIVVGQEQEEPYVDEEWLVFSRPVQTEDGKPGGAVEIAWLTRDNENGGRTLEVLKGSPLVVFFPTVVETGLGFLIQGPYRTTPSRDNVPPREQWNQICIRETGELLIESLRWLREKGLLDATGLTSLPIDPERFEGSMFRELFERTKEALEGEDLLPAHGGTYASAGNSCLARTEDLRQLLSRTQLAALLGHTRPMQWLDRTISRDRTPELYGYLVKELGIQEFTPEALLPRLTAAFLAEQTDDWIQILYKFLGSRQALRPRIKSRPIVRLEDGSHVAPAVDGEPQAFLPGPVETSFPTVRAAVCRTEEAREFLESLKLTEPDLVDNVIRNVLPKYQKKRVEYSEAEYSSDIALMLGAFETDSRLQQKRLVEGLRETPWVRAVDGSGRHRSWAKPGDLYLATERLRRLFDGVGEVLFVDAGVTCLRGSSIRDLLEGSGTARYLQTTPVASDLTKKEKALIRRQAGLERSTWRENIEDKSIRGLDTLVDKLATLDPVARASRAHDLWNALVDLNKRRGSRPFEAGYEWGYFHEKGSASFDAAFVRGLSKRHWVPDSTGNLRPPGSVDFEELGWEPNSLLQSKIPFRPPLLAHLAEEAGIELGVLDLLRQMGVTSEAELRKRLAVKTQDQNGRKRIDEHDGPPSHQAKRLEATTEDEDAAYGDGSETNDSEAEEGSTTSKTSRQFISYVGVVPEGEHTDPDGLEHSNRLKLEQSAIEIILSAEPGWQQTPPNNPGFDLFLGTTMETATRWCEVKAMTGTLDDRPVGLTRTQFEWAEEHGDKYWLYVVEHAQTRDARIVRIQDPAGKAKTFTFDRGWRAVAE